jgi:L-ribulose-5-phosphate 4-epimerase
MSAGEKGYVRFRCDWRRAPAPAGPEVEALRRWRDRLHGLGLIGVYPDGIGFGNLSHAAVYRSAPVARAAVHVHHRGLWERLRGRVPTTDPAAEAGTPEMALAIERLFRESGLAGEGLLVMGGHPEGLMAFGASADEAGERILAAFRALAG